MFLSIATTHAPATDLGFLLHKNPARTHGLDLGFGQAMMFYPQPDRLPHLERALFGDARPNLIVLTSPNRDYNAVFEGLEADGFRHPDHRFEWSRAELQAWAERVAAEHGYTVHFEGLGEPHPEHEPPSQMAVFTR